MKHYIAPLLPVEFQNFSDELEAFKVKKEKWKRILEAQNDKRTSQTFSRRASLFDELKLKFDLRNITVEAFEELFDKSSFEPKNLFPVEERKLIEVLEDVELVRKLSDERSELRSKQIEQMKAEDVDCAIEKPLKNEPRALSELLKQIESLRRSLRPFFVKVEEASRDESKIEEQTEVQTETQNEPELEASIELKPHHSGKWTTKNIYETSYDPTTRLLTFYAGRLGTFAFVTPKYWNLPLKRWELQPVSDEENKFVEMRLETQNCSVEINVTRAGYTFKIITNPRKPPFYELKSPVEIFELKRILRSLNVDIFPEADAGCYVDNSEKHKPMEFHTYKSMSAFCLSHRFKWNVWNRLAHRRVAIFETQMIGRKTSKTLMVTPLKAASVLVRENCTDLSVVELSYDLDPVEQQVSSFA